MLIFSQKPFQKKKISKLLSKHFNDVHLKQSQLQLTAISLEKCLCLKKKSFYLKKSQTSKYLANKTKHLRLPT